MSDLLRARVRLAMEMVDMTPNRLGDITGLGASYVGRFLKGTRGKSPQAATLVKMAVALGVSFEWLATGRGSPRDPAPHESAIPDAQPNRVPIYDTAAFRNAPEPVKEWFATRRHRPDLSTEDWRLALDYGTKLHGLGMLDAAPRGRLGKPSDER